MASMAPPATGASASLLLLGDGRLPAGGHAHSGGMEEAVRNGRVNDLGTVGEFLAGRLATSGLVAAALAAAACEMQHPLVLLDGEADARTASPALRAVSRRQGRQLLRAGAALWPAAALDELAGLYHLAHPTRSGHVSGGQGPPKRDRFAWGPHHPVALGAVARAAGLDGPGAALVAASWSVTGPASAAVRLLSLDPLAVHALVARLAPSIDEVAAEGALAGGGAFEDLPCAAAPLLDVGAERHATWEARLFAS
jgi:urease accessory protein